MTPLSYFTVADALSLLVYIAVIALMCAVAVAAIGFLATIVLGVVRGFRKALKNHRGNEVSK